jgi:phosphatidylinositol N-acetylglucosaminyltransferase subunit P
LVNCMFDHVHLKFKAFNVVDINLLIRPAAISPLAFPFITTAMPSSSDECDTLFQSHYANDPVPSSSSPSPSPSPPPLQHNFFAPPFYNRPPTPLPPSPSLTSLLRPSRPTTPDSSDNDLSPSGARHPVPHASPVVPTYEYYGFVLYLFSSLTFLIYLLWSYLPSPFLHALSIYYYPNRWWSLAIPSFLVMSLVYMYVALASYNTGYLTLPLASIETIVDEAANIAGLDGKGTMKRSYTKGNGKGRPMREVRETKAARPKMETGKRDWRSLWSEGTDAVMDVPLGGVCEVLYGEGRDPDPEDT